MCFIHRDHHPWNVLADSDGKLYVVDLPLSQGDFRFDVGWTYMLMFRSGFRSLQKRFYLITLILIQVFMMTLIFLSR